MATIEFRHLRDCDEEQIRRAHDSLKVGDNFGFLLFFDPAEPWADYVASVERQEVGEDLGAHMVPESFRVAVVDGQVAGRVSVRHGLTYRLLVDVGHIGMAVLPQYRRQGIGVALVHHGLEIARSHGVSPILASCNTGNLASASTLLAAGGQEEVAAYIAPDAPVRRFWFDLG